jgi:hypothetical protein
MEPVEERIFFSEEKKQKTLISSQLDIAWPRPGSSRARRNKSFLVLFFKKEHSSFALSGRFA